MAKAAEKSTDMQPVNDADQLLEILSGAVEPPPVDQAALNERITRAMLAAETPQEAALAGATVAWEDLLGVPIEVRDIAFRKSTVQGEGLPVFLIVDGYRLDEGLACTITCGAAMVVRTLAVWKAKGWLPQTFRVDKAETPTAGGFFPYTITPL